MTDEQIKQKAIKAATEFKDCHHPQMSFYDGYIAGAHSRDEEIAGYQMQINMTADALQQCMDELKQLRNPWISVEDRLPRKLRKKNYSKEVLCRADGGTLLVSIYNYKKCEWTDGIYIKITHWMSIPELKGE